VIEEERRCGKRQKKKENKNSKKKETSRDFYESKAYNHIDQHAGHND
jgi:hypothetical protein